MVLREQKSRFFLTYYENLSCVSKCRGGYVFKDAPIERLMEIYLCAPHSNHFQKGMDIYLAGAATGNNNYLWRKEKPDKVMNLFLAGTHAEKNRANSNNDFAQKIHVLESFYYIDDWMIPYIKNHWNFMLDSGAFTFMNDTKNTKGVNWDEYLERYALFINTNDINLFFELDIDSVVGLKEVERLRKKLESLTNKKCIPVWHKSRGLDYWKWMVKEYNYVALGGMASADKKKYRTEFKKYCHQLLFMAHKNNCKVHALGFTEIKTLHRYKFDSVDSTAWIYGNRGGFLYRFNGRTIDKIQKPNGTRLNSKKAAIHNFKEWVKYQKYAEKCL